VSKLIDQAGSGTTGKADSKANNQTPGNKHCRILSGGLNDGSDYAQD
jgi:hypothetical protein